jgi:hypothetical protein
MQHKAEYCCTECRYVECPYYSLYAMLNVGILNVIMLNVPNNPSLLSVVSYAECRYAECRYAVCRYADCSTK